MMRLVVLAALVAVALAQASNFPFPDPAGNSNQQCSDVFFCLQEGETDCNTNVFFNHRCASGLYCQLGTTINATTGEFVGTCRQQPRLGEPCSLENNNEVYCFDPDYPTAITCDDPSFNGSGICRYASVFYPGEQCSSDSNFINGGCIYGSCTSGLCSTVPAGTRCDQANRNQECPVGQFCDEGNTDLCVARKGLGAVCDVTGDDIECDQLLVCTRRGGIYEERTCLEPFVGKEGSLCSNLYDCGAGLFCLNGVCQEPASFKRDTCVDDGDCQFGWGCDCKIEISGRKIAYKGGKCTRNTAISSAEIRRWKKYQQCCKDNSCPADFGYLEQYGSSGVLNRDQEPNSCAFFCFKEAGYSIQDLGETPEGKCLAPGTGAAGALLPALAVVFTAVLALLF